MKRITLILFSICMFTAAHAQTSKSGTKKTLKKVMSVTMPGDGGSNGASIAYHPTLKKYYIPMVGNESFPFATFDAKGKLLDEQIAGNDLRGLWYNPKTKNVEGNCYADGGWVAYKINAKGEIDINSEKIHEGMKQPTEQSVGAFNSKNDKVYFLTTTGVSIYNRKGEEEKILDLKISKDADPLIFDNDNEYYNNSALIYTGIPKAEIGLLNIIDNKIELFNSATGIKTTEWILPNTVATLQQSFNFAYANNMVWLFDKENRTWVVYK